MKLMRRGKVWHYRFQVDGKRIHRSTRESVKYKAENIARKAYDDAILWARGDRSIPTLEELCSQWIIAHEGISSDHHIKSVRVFQRRHMYDLGEHLIDEITTDMVAGARKLHMQTHAPASVNHWLNCLSCIFGWAVKRKVIPVVPWSVPRLKLQQKPKVVLPVSVALQWIDAIDASGRPGVSTAVRLMIGLGLREGEALSARWEWIDWDRRTYTPGKTKGREAAPLPMAPWLVAYLQAIKGEGLIVTHAGKPYHSGFARGFMRRANAACGIGNVTPHRLRGTWATLLSEAGLPWQVIQALMRHKDPKTTRGYLETNLEMAQRGQAIVADRLGLSLDRKQ